MAKNIIVENKGNKSKWLKPIMWVLVVFIALNVLLTTAGNSLADWFNLDIGQDWRETVSTDNGIKGNVNGGLTEKEIEEFEEYALYKPFYEDIFRNAVVAESENYVTIYRQLEGTTDFYNLNFVKTPKGLVYDGVVGVKTNVPFKQNVKWLGIKIGGYLHGQRDFTKATTTLDTKIVSYKKTNKNIVDFFIGLGSGSTARHQNIVTFSDFNNLFAEGFNHVLNFTRWTTIDEQNKLLFNYITKYLAENVMQPHFQTITDNSVGIDVELINGIENVENPEAVKRRLNTFATYLWENSRSENGADKQTVVDVSNYYGSFIPTELQENYPLQGEDVEQFDGFDYYPLYDNKTMFNVAYITTDNEPDRKQSVIQTDPDVIKDSANIDQERPAQEEEFARLNIKLDNKTNSDLAPADLKENPVVIKIGDRTLVFDSPAKIKAGATLALPANQIYYYTINSKELVFDSLSGSIATNAGGSVGTRQFHFTYLQNYINVGVSLMPITSTSEKIDLVKNPVLIILNGQNGEGSYHIRFDNNSKLNEQLYSLVPSGEYRYEILSNQLLFISTGDITVDSTTRNFIFKYSVDENMDDTKLTITADKSNTYGEHNMLHIKINPEKYNLWEYLGDFEVFVYVFDKDGNIVISENKLVEEHLTSYDKNFLVNSNGLFANDGVSTHSVQLIISERTHVRPKMIVSNKVMLPNVSSMDYISISLNLTY